MYSPQIKTMIDGFTLYQKPTCFLTSFARETVTDFDKIELDKRSVKNVYAVDVERDGARMLNFNKFETMEYTPPYYNQYDMLTPAQFDKRQFGKTVYEKVGNLNNFLNERQGWLSDTIVNAIEKMVSDALFNNQITLSDGSIITFNRKNTHYINRQNEKWSDSGSTTGNPISQLNDMCQLLVDDAKVSGAGAFQLICARNTVNALLTNEKFINNTKFDAGIKLTDIKMPTWNVNGATFHGQFSAGSFRINLWSYNAKFEVPSGYGYANEGTLQPFIPNGTALLLPEDVRFDLIYAGIDNSATMINNGSIGNINSLAMIKTKQLPYAYWSILSVGTTAFVYGVKARPLFIPTNNDCFCISYNLV
jgi:hypothetical protein